MASRTLLCVEPEESAVSEIRAVLEPYGFEVTNIPNGEAAIEWARQNTPDLVIVSVEPRKVGYAVCNKLKRSPELQNIPLVLTSGEETPQTFEQHKKLRSRADEYILKPFRSDELLAKVGGLIQLGHPRGHGPADDGAIEEEGAFAAIELDIGESDIIEHKTPGPVNPQGNMPNPMLDPRFEEEADAAFAALQGPGETAAPMPAFRPVPDFQRDGSGPFKASPHVANEWDDEKTSTSFFADSGFMVEPPTPPPVMPSPEHLALFPSGGDLPSPDEVSVTSALPILHDPGEAQRTDSRVADLTARISTLENERRGLHEQIEELKLRLQSQPLSKEKEFLSLREAINRKEKDILDLRDALDTKDRQILDQKDRVREHERARRDLEERMLDFEKNLMAAQERVSALTHDKEKAGEREKALKARLDDALTEIQKAHDESDTFKRRLGQAEEKSRAEIERVRKELEATMADTEEHHRSEVARLSDERVEAEEDLKSEMDAEIARLRQVHAAELEALNRRLTEEKGAAEERFTNELAQRRKEHEKAIAAARDEQTMQLAAERQAHQAAIEAKEQNHRNEVLGLRRRLEDELAAAEERRQRELAEAEARRVSELEAAEQRRRSELQAREEDYHGKLAEMDRRHLDEQGQQGERHRQELDQAHARASRAEGELAARMEELAEAQRRLGQLAADRDALHADVREREVKMAQLRERTAELEGKSAEYEEQILRAYQKLRADEKVVDRAKRALAVALNLLDDRAGAGAGNAAGSATPAAVGASPSGPTAVAARPPGEEAG